MTINSASVLPAHLADRACLVELFALVAPFVAPLQHARAAVERHARDLARVASRAGVRIDDHVQAGDRTARHGFGSSLRLCDVRASLRQDDTPGGRPTVQRRGMKARDFAWLLLLGVIWGSAFLFINVAVSDVPR